MLSVNSIKERFLALLFFIKAIVIEIRTITRNPPIKMKLIRMPIIVITPTFKSSAISLIEGSWLPAFNFSDSISSLIWIFIG